MSTLAERLASRYVEAGGYLLRPQRMLWKDISEAVVQAWAAGQQVMYLEGEADDHFWLDMNSDLGRRLKATMEKVFAAQLAQSEREGMPHQTVDTWLKAIEKVKVEAEMIRSPRSGKKGYKIVVSPSYRQVAEQVEQAGDFGPEG